jgi:50S ribosomal protein L16 3-hydroxylase
MLYVPPGIAHEGVAVGDDCMTYSIGFRAPSSGDLIAGWSEHLLGQEHEEDRYADPDLEAQDNPGEISAGAIDRLHALATCKMLDRDSFARWFGLNSSIPKYPDMDWRPQAPIGIGELRERLADDPNMVRNPASRFSFIRPESGSLLLFADGECFECAAQAALFAEQLCANHSLTIDRDIAQSDVAMAVITRLFNQGSVAFRDDG